MTQLIAHLKQLTVGEGLQPSQFHIVARVVIAFSIGLLVATLVI